MKRKYLINCDLIKSFRVLFWTCSIFCYFFQFPFYSLSKYIVPFILLFIASEYNNIKIKKDYYYIFIYSLFFIYLGLECFNSIYNGTEITRIIRFLEILSIIPICLIINDDKFSLEINILFILAIVKCLILIGVGVFIIKAGSSKIIRNWVRLHNVGDVFLAKRYRPKIQTLGNGLLPFIFMAYYSKYKKINIASIILFLGIIVAGNFAYILGIVIFFILQVYLLLVSKKNSKGYITPFMVLFIILILPFAYKFINIAREEKSGLSNAVRIEQAKLLSNTNYFIGNGLGKDIEESDNFRNYNGVMYFELQTLYIFNQIGIIGLLLFYLITIWKFYTISKLKLMLFFIYLFYSFWNPYCFDTTEMIVIISLINISDFGDKKNYDYCNNNTVLPYKRKYSKYIKYIFTS
jgi:hypothetical protein